MRGLILGLVHLDESAVRVIAFFDVLAAQGASLEQVQRSAAALVLSL